MSPTKTKTIPSAPLPRPAMAFDNNNLTVDEYYVPMPFLMFCTSGDDVEYSFSERFTFADRNFEFIGNNLHVNGNHWRGTMRYTAGQVFNFDYAGSLVSQIQPKTNYWHKSCKYYYYVELGFYVPPMVCYSNVDLNPTSLRSYKPCTTNSIGYLTAAKNKWAK